MKLSTEERFLVLQGLDHIIRLNQAFVDGTRALSMKRANEEPYRSNIANAVARIEAATTLRAKVEKL